ncbi:AAA family ATPase [Pleurocapsales cyanobacterium LEGE 06147]|nr:AAA family ATPase [Pleurocapsales cyanobacterium LEGE 06147]
MCVSLSGAKGLQKRLQSAEIIPTTNKNLFLLAGHIDLSENESQLAVALTTGAAIPALQNLPGSVTHLIKLTAQSNNIDIILLDMSPSVGALNQCFLIESDYFIVPTSPDYYCDRAIRSLARVIPKWNTVIASFRNSQLTYPFEETPPRFLGTISQRYRPHSGNPAASFQRWIDQIKKTSNTELVPALSKINMVISEEKFLETVNNPSPEVRA